MKSLLFSGSEAKAGGILMVPYPRGCSGGLSCREGALTQKLSGACQPGF